MDASTAVITAAPDTLQDELLRRLKLLKAHHPSHTLSKDGQAVERMLEIDRAITAAHKGNIRASTEIINGLWGFYCYEQRFDLAVQVVQIRRLRYEQDEARVA